MLLISMLLIALAINFFLFLIAYKNQSDKLTDFAYSLSFITIVAAAYSFSSHRTVITTIASLLVLVWALRLGGFLVYRIRKSGTDTRFDSIRGNFFKFLQFWLAQGVVAWFLLLPLLFASQKDAGQITWLFWLGLGVWLLGFIVEVVADVQKTRFKQRASSKGKWIDEGLWHYSRHPNYFGEITVWVGMYLLLFASLSPLEYWIGILSPLSIAITLLFVSGVPPLEKYADEKWGKNKAYQAYKRGTSLIIPLWPRR